MRVWPRKDVDLDVTEDATLFHVCRLVPSCLNQTGTALGICVVVTTLNSRSIQLRRTSPRKVGKIQVRPTSGRKNKHKRYPFYSAATRR